MKIQFSKSKGNKSMVAILFMALQFILILPEIVSLTPLYSIIRYLQHLFTIIAIILFLMNYRKNMLLILCLAFFLLYTFSTILNGGELSNIVYNFERSFMLMLYYKLICDYDQKLFYKWSSNYWMCILVINAVLTFARPYGMLVIQSQTTSMDRVYYFLGVSNQVIPFYIIGITISMIYEFLYTQKSTRAYLLITCMWISEFVYQSATSFLGCVIFTLGYLIFVRRKSEIKVESYRKRKRRNRFIVLTCITVFIGYYLVVIGKVQNYFAIFIESILHKNVTLSTRTIIWDIALQMIKDSWMLGYGAVANNNRYIFVGSFSFNAHNIILQILLMGGLVLLVIFGILIYFTIRDIIRCNNIKIRYIMLMLFTTFFFMSLTEVYSLYLNLIVFCICNVNKYSLSRNEGGRINVCD